VISRHVPYPRRDGIRLPIEDADLVPADPFRKAGQGSNIKGVWNTNAVDK